MSLSRISCAAVAWAAAALLATRALAQDAPAAAAPTDAPSAAGPTDAPAAAGPTDAPAAAGPTDAPAAAAPTHAPAETPPVEEEIIVRGHRMSEIEFNLPSYIRKFIGQVAALPAGRGFARWHRSLCVGVYNLKQDAAHYIVDHVSSVAAQLGLEPGEPGCTPNDIIIFTVDAEHLATYMVKHRERLFRPGMGLGHMDRGYAALQEFARSDKPVRWWQVSMPVDARSGARAVVLPQDPAGTHPVISVAGPSRIHSGIVDYLDHVIIIVDATKLTGTTWQQLADYIAMVSLAQIDPKTDPQDFDTILNLFGNPAAYSGLTDWDRSYLRALYTFDQERAPQLQAGELVSQMVKWENASGE